MGLVNCVSIYLQFLVIEEIFGGLTTRSQFEKSKFMTSRGKDSYNLGLIVSPCFMKYFHFYSIFEFFGGSVHCSLYIVHRQLKYIDRPLAKLWCILF